MEEVGDCKQRMKRHNEIKPSLIHKRLSEIFNGYLDPSIRRRTYEVTSDPMAITFFDDTEAENMIIMIYRYYLT